MFSIVYRLLSQGGKKIDKEHTFDDFTCVNASQNMCESRVYLDALDFISIIRLRRLFSF